MTESVEHPDHDPSDDEELSESLAGHSELPGEGAGKVPGASSDGEPSDDSTAGTPADEELSASLEGHSELPDGDSDVLEEIDDSPVNTENS